MDNIRIGLPYDAYKEIIERKYSFPICDVEVAVNLLNDLPKECQVDLPRGVNFDNLQGAKKGDGEYSLIVLCKSVAFDPFACKEVEPCRIHVIFKEVVLKEYKNVKHIVIHSKSGAECLDTPVDKYVSNDEIITITPSTDDIYDIISMKRI